MSLRGNCGVTTHNNMHSFPLDYHLPPHLIAQEPSSRRDQARLLVVNRQEGTLAHRHFHDLPELLRPGDLLVLNDTKVVPARLLGRRQRTGGKWEGLFIGQLPDGAWEILGQTRGRLLPGETIVVEPGPLQLQLLDKTPEGHWLVRPSEPGNPFAVLERHGQVPLPPYIRKGRAKEGDRQRYQTVFADRPGSVAAPTAGLHFTPEMFQQLLERNITWSYVTLHVGLGTFLPIQAEDYTQHPMHREWGELPAETVAAIAACKERGGRVVAVGSTSVRVLETVAATGPLRPWAEETDLFIYPPYNYQVVDALITNFHLPRSTLLLLVCAFAGVDLTRRAYETAIEKEYRFYSYGDAMLIV